MPLFKCFKCGCIENTAVCNYWWKWARKGEQSQALCSECDPDIEKWHNEFKKSSAKGMLLGNDGFLYSKEDLGIINNPSLKIVAVIN